MSKLAPQNASRRWRFTLRTVFGFVAAFAVVCSTLLVWLEQNRRQRSVALEMGATASFKNGVVVGLEWPLPMRTRLGDRDLRRVKDLPSLEELEVYGQEITDKGVKYIVQCNSLRKLVISNSQLTDVGLRLICDKMDLESLGLGNLKNITDFGLRHLREQINLRRLSLTRLDMTGVFDGLLTSIFYSCL